MKERVEEIRARLLAKAAGRYVNVDGLLYSTDLIAHAPDDIAYLLRLADIQREVLDQIAWELDDYARHTSPARLLALLRSTLGSLDRQAS